ncbi:MAG: aminopeptidase P family N-terminal domain-containing protein, partial [Candidatus Puniceispirillaceae bacterium]
MTEAPARGFSDAEFAARTERAQIQMAAEGLDGLLLMTEPELYYFSGFQTLFWQSPTRPWFLFIPASGKPIAVIPEIGAELMRRGWLDDVRTWSAPQPEDDGISILTELMSPLASKSARLGLMKGHETLLRMPLGDWERLMAALPGIRVADATGLMQALRMVKTDAEIEKLAHICAIGSATFAATPEFLRE